MSSVAIASCLSADGRSTFPDADLPLLQNSLHALGIDAAAAAWEDPDIDWSAFDLVVIRSTWTSVEFPERYLRWLNSTASMTRVENNTSLIAWNFDKRHLLDVQAADIPIVPTTWVAPDQDWRPPAGPFVVKPAVSGGGRETAMYTRPSADAVDHVRRLQAGGATVMVQPYVESVDVVGETKMVYIDGQLSHALNVGPLLEPDAGVCERPWEKRVSAKVCTPTPAETNTADRVMAFIEARFEGPLYGRVDTCMVQDEPAVLEIEFVDPSLSLSAAPEAPGHLASAIARRLP